MAITFHPKPGAIFICDYSGFVEPEITKRRLCVVITPRLRKRDGLCTVVPLSTTPPDTVFDYHYSVDFAPELPKPWEGASKWAKCDMFATVSYERLSGIGLGRDRDGKRRYLYPHVDAAKLKEIRAAVLCALNMQNLTQHL
ncbi:type II toxin-antitoxin system PemK/MazF family toxin [Brevundimonas sp.]|uniref:type II toxin-antitoxin system PemK/MazF family toxin n=1 Tax=Brevundimonas sp. TaxID=1871086 RepID=UPI003F70B34F